MSDICYPPDTDWSCKFEPDELERLRDDEVKGPLIERSEAFAWSTLAALTAYQIGQCPITVRPCALGCLPAGYYQAAPVRGGHTGALPAGTIGMMNPYITGGRWVNGCGCRTSCSCTALSEVILPGPVGRITAVWVDGFQLPRSAYRVDNGNRLVRLDGDTWPVCQDMTRGDQDGFSVQYYRGAAPNAMTRAAAGALAAEFYAGCEGENCRLPDNLVRMNRQGEAYEFSPTDFEDILEVKAVVMIYNPYGLKSRPTVTSPDTINTRMRTA